MNHRRGRPPMMFYLKTYKIITVMTKTEEFLSLRKRIAAGNLTAEESLSLNKRADEIISSLTEGEKQLFFEAVKNDIDSVTDDLRDAKRTLTIKEKLEPILEGLNVSYISRRYFKRSPHWFYQRLNGNIVNGKPASFTEQELSTLNLALHDIGEMILAFKL